MTDSSFQHFNIYIAPASSGHSTDMINEDHLDSLCLYALRGGGLLSVPAGVSSSHSLDLPVVEAVGSNKDSPATDAESHTWKGLESVI